MPNPRGALTHRLRAGRQDRAFGTKSRPGAARAACGEIRKAAPRITVFQGRELRKAIHHIWQRRLQGLGREVLHYSSLEACEADFFAGQPARAQSLFLVDYEFLGEGEDGLMFIQRMGIAVQSILVTSHFEEVVLQQRSTVVGVKILPKGLASTVPFGDRQPREEIAFSGA